MRIKDFRRHVLMAAILLAIALVAEAQVGNFLQRAKKTVAEKTNMVAENVTSKTLSRKPLTKRLMEI